jgi:hypothetical protein
MRKMTVFLVVMLCFIVAVPLGALSQDKKDIGLKTFTIVSGPPTGAWYPVGAKIGELIGKNCDVKVTVDVGGSAQNVRRVDAATDADMGLASTPEVWYATKGMSPFKKEYKNVTVLGALVPYYFQVLVREGSGIHEWKDMRDKRYSPSKAGTGSEMLSRIILQEAGLDYSSIRKAGGAIEFRGYGPAAEAMKDGNLDAMAASLVYPYGVYTEYLMRNKGYFLPVEGKFRDKIIEKYPAYSAGVIPANVYKGQTEPLETIYYYSVLIIRKDLSESAVYEITKVIYENDQQIRDLMAGLKLFSKEHATDWSAVGFHPGAKKYYQEAGVWKQ